MIRRSLRLAGLGLAFAFTTPLVPTARAVAAPSCTPTGYTRDGINLTAALVDPAGTVSGDVDATGCNIGVFYSAGGPGGAIDKANVHGANYFGVVNLGAVVNVTNSHIYNIGEVPFNGAQHGVGYYCNAASGANGTVSGNLIDQYQKGGIALVGRGCSSIAVDHNTVTGLGPVDFIAQNGIEVGLGTKGTRVTYNIVSGNIYTGSNEASSGGILAFGGKCFGGGLAHNLRIEVNTVYANDVGIYVLNYNANCQVNGAVTENQVKGNVIWSGAVFNTTGNVSGPYQAGVAEAGNGDQIVRNSICGAGYDENTSGSNWIKPIDAAGLNSVISGNVCAETKTPVTASVSMTPAALTATAKGNRLPQPFVP